MPNSLDEILGGSSANLEPPSPSSPDIQSATPAVAQSPTGSPTGLAGFVGSLADALGSSGILPTWQQWGKLTSSPVIPPWVIGQPVVPGQPLAYNPSDTSTYYTGNPATAADDRVYMGKEVTTDAQRAHMGIAGADGTGDEFGMTGSTQTHGSITVQAALNQPYLWGESKILETEKKMREAGLSVNSFDEMNRAWQGLVMDASKKFALSGGTAAVTPWDQLALTRKENIAAGVIDKNGNISKTSTHTSVMDVTDGDTWAAMRSTAQQLLGRDPTDQEVKDLASRASNVASNHPTTTTTTSTMDAATGQTSSSTDTSQGFDSNDLSHMAYNDAQGNPDYGAYQAATTYTNALLGALGEVAPGG